MLTKEQVFYLRNADIFGKYFEDGDYKMLVLTNLKKVKETINDNSSFDFETWNNIRGLLCQKN